MAGVTWDPSKGMLAGQIRVENGSPRSGAAIHVTDETGNPLAAAGGGDASKGVVMYLDGSGAPVVGGQASSRFVVFNIPIPAGVSSRMVYVTVRIEEQSTEGVPGRHVGTLIAPVLRNAVMYHPITVASARSLRTRRTS